MIVTCCKECPFFRDSAATVLSALSGVDAPWGFCHYDRKDDSLVVLDWSPMKTEAQRAAMMERAKDRMAVVDGRVIPEGCPLRTRDVRISLGS